MGKRDSYRSSIITVMTLLFVGVVMPIFIMSLIAYINFTNYEPALCNITNVSYPTEFPDTESLDLWSTCDCGRRCTSRYPCVNLYSSINENQMMKYSYSEKDFSCTITEELCLDGEDPYYTQQYLNEAIRIGESYINSTVSCFVNRHDPENNPIYIHLDTPLNSFIALTVVSGILLIIIVTLLVLICKEENECCKKPENTEKLDSVVINEGFVK